MRWNISRFLLHFYFLAGPLDYARGRRRVCDLSWRKEGFYECDQGEHPVGAGQDTGECQAGAQAGFVAVEDPVNFGVILIVG